MTPELSISDAYRSRHGGVPFGLALITGSKNPSDPPEFQPYKRKLLRKMRARATLQEISRRISLYNDYFGQWGYECPLPKHLKRVVNSGFPRYNLMVDAHFMAEMCAGILVAVGDFGLMVPPFTLDLAGPGETFVAMGGRELRVKEGEVVLRDTEDIICVLCQGADERTRIRDETTDVMFYAYGVPGIEAQYIEEGLTIAAETTARFGGGRVLGITIKS